MKKSVTSQSACLKNEHMSMTSMLTLMSSGSHESSVRDRTFEKWTPKLLQTQKPIQMHVHVIHYIILCVHVCYLCMPEQVMHSVMPRLIEAQSGPGSPQSQHCPFPEMACTSSRASRPDCSGSPELKRTLPADTELQRSLCLTHTHTQRYTSFYNTHIYVLH